jgi:hypothetical protein
LYIQEQNQRRLQRKLAQTDEEKKKLVQDSVKAFKEAFPTLHQSVKEVVREPVTQTGYLGS